MPAIITRGAASAKAFGWSGGKVVVGQQAYTTPSATNYTWVAPAGVTRVSVVTVGAGQQASATTGGSGGGLSYINNYTVVPGNSYCVRVGTSNSSCAISYFVNSATVSGNSNPRQILPGSGGSLGAVTNGGSGGGAGGYTAAGNSGVGGSAASGNGIAINGCGGVYWWDASGGVGILGQGASGTANTGQGGSGGAYGTGGGQYYQCYIVCCVPTGFWFSYGGAGGGYGGGGAGSSSGNNGGGGGGAVRIIWPGCVRSFPSTRTADE